MKQMEKNSKFENNKDRKKYCIFQQQIISTSSHKLCLKMNIRVMEI